VIFIGALSLWEAVKREWGANGGRLYAVPDTTPERSVQENHIDPTHRCVRCHSQLVDGKRNLVGPQDKLTLTAGLHNGRTKEQIA
jgi:hypothetical protein